MTNQQEEKENNSLLFYAYFRVEVATVEDVPDFGPSLPQDAFFSDPSDLRFFILAKLINAEYAALKSPKFAQPMARAREASHLLLLLIRAHEAQKVKKTWS
ncbi:hypothetical protein BDF14DRAFT_664110 [Spinellus fusiger]|nr:hypothetical protein BDF14DRAFT_664110 [Spinellus fusiger]